MIHYDVAIIGGGPAGYTAAGKAAANGLKTVLFEKDAIGGVCLNEGCIPSKTILYSAKIIDNINASSKYGISVDGKPSADLARISARKKKTVRKLAAGIRMQLTGAGAEMIEGEACVLGENNGFIQVACSGETYHARNVLLCMGSEVIIPPVKGLSGIDFWTSREALEPGEIPQSLVIIGGGNIGMEFASFFNSVGTKVSVVEMMSEILPSTDKETAAMLRAEYVKKGVDFHLETKVTEIKTDTLIAENRDGKTELPFDKLLVCVGRKPDLKKAGVENINLELFGNGIKVNQYMQTSHPGIYACGDITGFSMLAHTAVREAEVAVNHILGNDDEMSYKAIPFVTYTNPEVAGVGRTEEDLIRTGEEYTVLKKPMAFSGRFVAENEMGNGLCKLIIDKKQQVTGCHLLGNPSSELIAIAGIAIEKGFSVKEFQQIVFAHPTVGEIFHETLFSKD